jgi:signal transduction histidine kinase
MPKWVVVTYTPKLSAMAPVYMLNAMTLVIGLCVIGVLFLLGVLLVERSVTRRILRLQEATQQVSGGDLSGRVRLDTLGRRLMGRDEIDDLANGFIRIAGHELRTPVSYILGMARLLKESNDATRLLFAVQSMGAKARRLNEIIQAMFKLMPAGFEGQGMRYVQVDLSELLEEIYIDIYPFVESRNQRLIIEMVDRLPPIKVDRDKFRDIIENLVMNAIKFTPDGGIIKVRCSLQLGDRVSISVQDQGPGIPESELPRLFQPFYSGGDVMTHSTGDVGYQKRGMGLGLAVVRQFVDFHHGAVHVASSPLGTTFTVTIPVEPGPDEARLSWPRPGPPEI